MALDPLNRLFQVRTFYLCRGILSLIFLCFPASAVIAQSGVSNLKIGIGARSAGMGEAYAAVADDATATYWNPAGLVRLPKGQILFFHNEWLQDISSEFIAAVFPSEKHAIAFSFTSNNISDIEIRDNRPTVEPLGTFTAHDLVLTTSYARYLKKNLTLGLTLKYVYQKIYTYESGGLAGDVGFMYRFNSMPVGLGATLQNLGFMTELRDESPELPRIIRLGTLIEPSARLFNQEWILAADFVSDFDGNSHIQIGTEIRLGNSFAFRSGYQTGYDLKDFHFGFGYKTKKLMLDYGYIPLRQDFGQGHRFSIAYNL